MTVPAAPGRLLTAREREIVALIARGMTDAEIGSALWVATDTARGHVARILDKLEARSRAHAVARALETGQWWPDGASRVANERWIERLRESRSETTRARNRCKEFRGKYLSAREEIRALRSGERA